mmetsp:Transcript_32677/g.68543  ORF Transcript_32677/g.68543 Transcript_32677/m.68543 type:complete len:89 (-) Transcript_32677:292-558(-)
MSLEKKERPASPTNLTTHEIAIMRRDKRRAKPTKKQPCNVADLMLSRPTDFGLRPHVVYQRQSDSDLRSSRYSNGTASLSSCSSCCCA